MAKDPQHQLTELELKKLNSAFSAQKINAISNGIEFILTFDEWLFIWLESGKLPERGCRRGQFLMFRKDNIGSYSKDNVEIKTKYNNLSIDRTKYFDHKDNSRRRNIPFLLTFEEWLRIWVDSGHYHERGFRNGQYVMSRFGDKGPYSIDNVKIILAEENRKFKHTEKAKQQISKSLIGNKRSLGFKHPPEFGEKVSLSNK